MSAMSAAVCERTIKNASEMLVQENDPVMRFTFGPKHVADALARRFLAGRAANDVPSQNNRALSIAGSSGALLLVRDRQSPVSGYATNTRLGPPQLRLGSAAHSVTSEPARYPARHGLQARDVR
jgi:hypothetical protein